MPLVVEITYAEVPHDLVHHDLVPHDLVHIPLNTRFCAPFVKELYRCWSAIYGQHCIATTKVNI